MARVTRTAFTVLELLIVIAIIALIAALLFPLFVGARNTVHEQPVITRIHRRPTFTTLYPTSNRARCWCARRPF
ncbi:MAG: hypothetical protein KatS3mg022_0465 [Armatimonadota bacterium]|nr:MAG: hypothetical protein KatS3mg022_0465 [Armatimonadota bacterium]